MAREAGEMSAWLYGRIPSKVLKGESVGPRKMTRAKIINTYYVTILLRYCYAIGSRAVQNAIDCAVSFNRSSDQMRLGHHVNQIRE